MKNTCAASLSLFVLALALVCPVAGVSAQGLLLDDFTNGPMILETATTQMQTSTQTGPNILGGHRCTVLNVTGNPLSRRAALEIRNGYLFVDTGVRAHHAIGLFYGYDSDCSNTQGLNRDLTSFDRFRINFDSKDLGTAGAVVVFSTQGSSSFALSADAGLEFSVDAPFAEFVGDVNWTDVQQIAFVIQSGGLVSAHDYAITSVWAVSGR